MDSRIEKLRGARAAIAAQMQGMFKESRSGPEAEPATTQTITHEHTRHHEWISLVHERFPAVPTPSNVLVHIVVGGRTLLSLEIPAGSPMPMVGENVTVPWPFGAPDDAASIMTCRVTRRDFQLSDGVCPAVALHVQPLI